MAYRRIQCGKAWSGCIYTASADRDSSYFLSVLVFCAFGFMFFKMSMKHTRRIKGYPEEYKPVWNFFDIKAYIIMAVMMGGGIWLRYSGLVPDVFIAVFYTGLGIALTLAGVLFWIMFIRERTSVNKAQ